MKNYLKKILAKEFWRQAGAWASMHKTLSVIIALATLSTAHWGISKILTPVAGTQYVFGRVERGDLVVSVNGSGQVATASEVDIKPKTTGQTQTLGQIIAVKVQNGDTVKAGQVIAILDGKNTLQALNQARASVASAQASYDKLVNGPTTSDLSSINNSIQSSQLALSNLQQNIVIKIRSAYTSVAKSVYSDTDSFFNGPMSQSPVLSLADVNFLNQQLKTAVEAKRSSIGATLTNWKVSVDALTSASDLVTSLNDAITNLNIVRSYFDDMATLFASYTTSNTSSGQSSISSDKSAAASARSGIDSSINDLVSALQSYQSDQIGLEQDQNSLALKTAPPSAEDVTVAKAQLDNATASLANAEEAYASRIITAPFDGQIGGLNAQIGQQVLSSDSLGKIITAEKVVNISLNEVDAAKIAADDAVTLTFDAIPGISIKGHVVYIDPLGTVNQGVVSYAVEIKMDESNDAIKTGMTASATIGTESHTGVLIVPSSAIMTQNGRKYVLIADMASSTFGQMAGFGSSTRIRGFASTTDRGNFRYSSSTFTNGSSTRRFRLASSTRGNVPLAGQVGLQFPVTSIEVTTGISNNTQTEIIAGLSEGELIVTRTITNTAANTKTAAAQATTRTVGAGAATRGFGGGLGGGSVFISR